MGLKDVYRLAREEWLPKEQLRRRNPGAYVTARAIFRGDPTRVALGKGVYISGPTVVFCDDGGGLSGARLVIGDRTYVGEFNNIRCSGAPIIVGRDCLISQHSSIIGSNHGITSGTRIVDQPWSGDGVVIGDDVWIGAGCTILPGARIGDGAVIAAHSVVRGEVTPGAVMAGAPAREIRRR
ncbi:MULTISPECIES: acyltransferase [Arsenicicoccus]|uniref:Acyltransferase n=1 Tax=Arsenicicoccus bolidensis TaxID=229480 RepID=A0ABS9Q4I5_9MICO|nr:MULTISPECIES: acyltransferase [Arsenicicoccus]MCG7322772.1 acyltransferase [Arsenicicoccus bolidensis]